jgi:hypothetical protein
MYGNVTVKNLVEFSFTVRATQVPSHFSGKDRQNDITWYLIAVCRVIVRDCSAWWPIVSTDHSKRMAS